MFHLIQEIVLIGQSSCHCHENHDTRKKNSQPKGDAPDSSDPPNPERIAFPGAGGTPKKSYLPLEQLALQLSISRATLHRRKTAGRLSPDESDKLIRFSRLLEHAASVFGNLERGRACLKFPQYGLGDVVPLDYAKTEIGAREVDNLLGRIDYGVYS